MICLFAGVLLCGLGIFCAYMLTMIKRLTAAVDLQVKATQELLGEGSFTRISKSLSALNGAMPDILGGIKEFAGVMRMVFKANNPEDEGGLGVRQPRPTQPPADEGSAFIPYSEAGAAINEVTEEARRQKLVISDEQLAGMVTDEST
jgi:hypothetical protein